MIIVLKRFRFNAYTMQREKICDRFEYPVELNVKEYMSSKAEKYTEEGYVYRLAGVVVHSGTVDVGHYYSFIKERGLEKEKWYRFDDRSITDFNPNDLPKETFGGDKSIGNSYWNDTNDGRTRNVYMLFYEQVQNEDARKGEEKKQELRETVPPELLNYIKSENSNLLNERLRYDPIYWVFLKQIVSDLKFEKVTSLQCSSSDYAFSTIHLSTLFLLETVILENKEEPYRTWTDLLVGFYANHVPAARWFLYVLSSGKCGWLFFYLVECKEEWVRENFRRLVEVCLKMVADYELEFFYHEEFFRRLEQGLPIEITVTEESGSDVKIEQLVNIPVMYKFLGYLLGLMEETRPHWRHIKEYFGVIHFAVVHTGHVGRRILQQKFMLVRMLIDYYMGPHSPYWIPGKERIVINAKGSTRPLDLTDFFFAMAHMVVACHTDVTTNPGITPPPTSYSGCPLLLKFPDDIICQPVLFFSILKQAFNPQANALMVSHLAWENSKQTVFTLSALREVGQKAEKLNAFTCVMENLLGLTDTLAMWRVALALGYRNGGLFQLLQGPLKDKAKVGSILVWLTGVIKTNPMVAGWIKLTSATFSTKIIQPFFDDTFVYLRRKQKQGYLTITEEQSFKSYEELRAEYMDILTGTHPGVTSIHEYPPDFTINAYEYQEILEWSYYSEEK